MERKTVVKALKECKKNAKLDYAYSRALGDCMSCTNAKLASMYGTEAKGIWLKYFTFGMNRQTWNNRPKYIAHDMGEEQAKVVVETLKKYFDVEWDGSQDQCIMIKDKVAA